MKKFNFRRKTDNQKQFSSATYWEDRYQSGRNSGPGSYGRLAKFKAEVLNDFVRKNNIESVIEWGCGDGNQLKLGEYPKYLGLDVSKNSIKKCIDTFQRDPTKSFLHYSDDTLNDPAGFIRADLALSLDVIFHLVEDEVFESYMFRLFGSARKYVVIYSSNQADKNTAEHVTHRKFTDWTNKHARGWKKVKTIPNKYPYSIDDPENTSFSDFYIYSLYH